MNLFIRCYYYKLLVSWLIVFSLVYMKGRSKAAQLILQKSTRNNSKTRHANDNSNNINNNLNNSSSIDDHINHKNDKNDRSLRLNEHSPTQNAHVQKGKIHMAENQNDKKATRKIENNKESPTQDKINTTKNVPSNEQDSSKQNKIHQLNLNHNLDMDLNLAQNKKRLSSGSVSVSPSANHNHQNLMQKNHQNETQQFYLKNLQLTRITQDLQMQNYRLIQANFQMVQKNSQLFNTMKKSLLQALNLIEDFSYAEGVKIIYKLLNYIKGLQKSNGSSLIQEKFAKTKNKKSQEQFPNQGQIQKNKKRNTLLRSISQTVKYHFIPEPKLTFQIFNKPSTITEQLLVKDDNQKQREFFIQKNKWQYSIGQQSLHNNRNRNHLQNQNHKLLLSSHKQSKSFNEGVKAFQSEKIIDKRRKERQGQEELMEKGELMNINDINHYMDKHYNSRQRQRKSINQNLFKAEFRTQSVQSIVDTYSERESQVMSSSRFGQNHRQSSTKKSHQHQIIFHKTSRTANQEAFRMMLVQANVIQSLHSKIFPQK